MVRRKSSSKVPLPDPRVVPGNYAVRMRLFGRTYVRRFKVEPDPRSHFTQADYLRTFNEATRQMARLSQVDTMLNTLDDLKKSLATDQDAAKKANNSALAAKLARCRNGAPDALRLARRKRIGRRAPRTKPKLQEDVLGRVSYSRKDSSRRRRWTRSLASTWTTVPASIATTPSSTGVLPGVNAALKGGNQKALPAISTMTPR